MKAAKNLFHGAAPPLLGAMLIYCLGSGLGAEPALFALLITAVAVTLAVAAIERFGTNYLLWVLVILALMVAWGVLDYLEMPPEGLIADFFRALAMGVGMMAASGPQALAGTVQGTVLACVLTGLCTLGLWYLVKSFWGRMALGALLLGAMIATGVLTFPIGRIPVFMALLWILACITEASHRFSKGERQGIYISFVPFCALLAMVAVLMPQSENPISWQPVKDAMSAITRRIQTWGDELGYALGRFDDSFSLPRIGGVDLGFGSLDGGDGGESSVLLLADSRYVTRSPLYLRGTVSNAYTGESWEQNTMEGSSSYTEYQLELYEVLYSIGRGGLVPEEDEIFYTASDIELIYEDLVTKTLFYPWGLYSLEASGEDPYTAPDANIRFYGLKRQGLSYGIKFIMLNPGSQALMDHLRQSLPYSQDSPALAERSVFYGMQGTASARSAVFGPELYELLRQRAKFIEEHYSALPDTLPQRVYDLARELTDGLDNDYDRLKAIELWLSENLSYTSSPPETPSGRDYVDYFIFDSQEGYCTHFATAMAVLGRCVGIPTRYVEGVILDFSKKEGELFAVNSGSSHAWAEGYIQGFGWIELETSAGYNAGKTNPWARKTPVPTVSQAPISQGIGGGSGAQEEPEPSPEPSELLPPPPEPVDLRQYVPYAGGVVAAALIIALAALLLGRFARRRRWLRADSREKLSLLMADILSTLALLGYEIEEGETLSEFARRINHENLTVAAQIYIPLRYGQGEISQDHLDALLQNQQTLRRQAQKLLPVRKAIALRLSDPARKG